MPTKGETLDCNTVSIRTLLRGSPGVGVLPISNAQDFFCQVVPRLFELWSKRWGATKRLGSASLDMQSIDAAAVYALAKA